MKTIIPSIALLALCGCATTPPLPKAEIEVISPLQQSEEAIRGTPTRFDVGYGDDRAFWTRAQLFMNSYTGGFKTKGNTGGDSSEITITNRSNGTPKYVYEISRSPRADGVSYLVRCMPALPGARGDKASLNAQNLARFIKEGTLEVALLD